MSPCEFKHTGECTELVHIVLDLHEKKLFLIRFELFLEILYMISDIGLSLILLTIIFDEDGEIKVRFREGLMIRLRCNGSGSLLWGFIGLFLLTSEEEFSLGLPNVDLLTMFGDEEQTMTILLGVIWIG